MRRIFAAVPTVLLAKRSVLVTAISVSLLPIVYQTAAEWGYRARLASLHYADFEAGPPRDTPEYDVLN
jgi:hypothetical protein